MLGEGGEAVESLFFFSPSPSGEAILGFYTLLGQSCFIFSYL
jgi:hypothetical protein